MANMKRKWEKYREFRAKVEKRNSKDIFNFSKSEENCSNSYTGGTVYQEVALLFDHYPQTLRTY